MHTREVSLCTSSCVKFKLTKWFYLRAVYEYYATGANYKSLHAETVANSALWARYVADTSFRVTVNAYNHTIPFRRVQDIVEGFEFMDFRGPVDLKTPECHLVVTEECMYLLNASFKSLILMLA